MYVVTVTCLWRGIHKDTAVVIGPDCATANSEARKLATEWAGTKIFTPEGIDCEEEGILSGTFSSGDYDLIIHHPVIVINLNNGEQK